MAEKLAQGSGGVPSHRERVALPVGLQFLAVNGWQDRVRDAVAALRAQRRPGV